MKFYWQHDAEFQPGGLISVFDNGSDPPKEKQSRGLLLAPNLSTHTVTLLKQFTNPTQTLLAESQGNVLSLPGGNWLLGYGGLPNFTEFDSAGHVLFDATLGKNVQDFRTYLVAVERPSDEHALAGRSASRRGRGERRRQLERGDRSRLLAGARRLLPDIADGRGERSQAAASRRASRSPRRRPIWPCRR